MIVNRLRIKHPLYNVNDDVFTYISLRNLVYHEKKKLIEVDKGVNANSLFSTRYRHSLRVNGALILCFCNGAITYRITCLARMIINNLVGNEKVEDLLNEN